MANDLLTATDWRVDWWPRGEPGAPPDWKLTGYTPDTPAGPHPFNAEVIDGAVRVSLSEYTIRGCAGGPAFTIPAALTGHLGDALARFARCGEWRPPTRVVSVRRMPADTLRQSGIVYVGRVHRERNGMGDGGTIFPQSVLHNPFRVRPQAAEAAKRACVRDYREFLRGNTKLREECRKLRGRILGCWCGAWDGFSPKPVACHAVEIALLAEELDP